jgi:phosphoribosylamine--glycine ligase
MHETEKILVVGSGGREHALGWKIRHDNPFIQLYFAPGNGGTAGLGVNVDIDPQDIDHLAGFSRKSGISLTVVGPEVPLEAGIVDLFCEEELDIFGPSKQAARLESDKAWAAQFLSRYGVPQPQFRVFSEPGEALAFLDETDPRTIVIKASGLCAGKGVVLPASQVEARETVESMMNGSLFGEAGRTVVIQERLKGPELSVMAFADGEHIVPMISARDHKRAGDNDTGPNTGGMGAFAPVEGIAPELMQEIERSILSPTVTGMSAEGHPYRGVLYAGLMLTREGPKVLEFNVRFGDPETQPLVMLLQGNLVNIFQACTRGSLTRDLVSFRSGAAVCVVVAAVGYPGEYAKGLPIQLPEINPADGIQIFHAGTTLKNGRLETSGGRVLAVTAFAASKNQASEIIYSFLEEKNIFPGQRYRRDIGSTKKP